MDDDNTTRTVFRKWLVLIVSIFTYGTGTGIPSSLSVMFLDWQDTFMVSRAHTAVVHSTCISIVLGGAVFAGFVMNRFGARLTMMFGSVLASAGMFISAFATSINFLIVSVGIVSGIGFCFVQLPVIPCVTTITKRYRTIMIALCSTASALVSLSNQLFIRYLVNQYSWRGTCIILAGLTLQCCIGGMIITAVIKPAKSSVLIREEKEKNELEDVNEIGFNNKDDSINVNYRKTGSKQLSHGNQIDHGSNALLKCSNSYDERDLSRTNSQSIIIENDIEFYEDSGKDSRWRFLLDVMFILLVVHIGSCVASLYSFSLILMDFAKTLGYDESTGVLFLTTTFAASLLGRLGVGILSDVFSNTPSFIVQTSMAIPGSLCLLLLSFCRDYVVVVCLLGIVGISAGGLISIYARCALDVKSVDRNSYPIVFGFFCTTEGVMALILSITIGFIVDITGSYTLILILIGGASLLSTFSLGCGYCYTSRQQKIKKNQQQ